MTDEDLKKHITIALDLAGLSPDEVRVDEDGHGSFSVYIEGLTLAEDGTIIPAMREYRVTGTARLRGTFVVEARSVEEARRIAEYALAEEVDQLVGSPSIESVEEVRV